MGDSSIWQERERLKIHIKMLSGLCQQFQTDTGYLPSPLFACVDIKWFSKSAANQWGRGFVSEQSDYWAFVQVSVLTSPLRPQQLRNRAAASLGQRPRESAGVTCAVITGGLTHTTHT